MNFREGQNEGKGNFRRIKRITERETLLSKLCDNLVMSQLKILGLIRDLCEEGINILVQERDGGICLFNPNDLWDEAGKDKNKVKQLVRR